MILNNPVILVSSIIISFLIIKFLRKSSPFYLIKIWYQKLEDSFHAYQFYRVPQFNEHMQENQLYNKVYTYLNSKPCIEDSDFANLFSGSKPNDINLVLGSDQIVVDNFLGARVQWIYDEKSGRSRSLVLKIRRNDKRRILQPYLQHIHNAFDEVEQRNDEVKLYINAETQPERNGRWRSVPFSHPATIDTIVMDTDLKSKVKSDLETFLKSKQYYRRLGRVWRRSYLLYGPSGTGKSSFAAAMAKLLSYDVYDVDLSRVSDDSDLRLLLLQTSNKSVIVIEDLDRWLAERASPSPAGGVSISGILNFMDGIFSCCGEERVMVFTMNGKDQIDPTVLRPGRIDVHINFPLCDFTAFKGLASNYLGLKDHKLFPQVEEIIQTGASLSPAEIGEIMISNRSSPSRALKSVITALQSNKEAKEVSRHARRLSESRSVRAVDESGDPVCKESFNSVKEFRKLYGLLRMRSSRKESLDLDAIDKENSHHHDS